jgi:penicillin-binding protein 1A
MALLFGVIGFAVGGYIIYHYSRDLPDYTQLKQYHPPSITRMYSSDGKLIEEYAKEHRIFVPISAIPRSLREAFVAAEDKNFYHHSGIDIVSILRAAITNVSHIIKGRRVEGGSTITQQVVKNFLLTSERSLDRKIKEAILSYMISQVFSKDEILELYLNQIYLGKGAYGVASAALNYFNKSVEELTLNESAVLASLPKAPSKFNPERNYKRAFARKNYVLGRMFDEEYITEEQAREALEMPIKLAKFDKVQTLDADYYASKVREEVINMFGEEYFYTAGLTILTCVDSKMQEAAANALRFGIKKYDMKRG